MANSRDFTGKNRKFTGTKGIVTPKGTTGQRVGSESGELRFNTTIELMEYYDGNQWKPIDAPPTITTITTSDAQGTNNILNADGSTLHTITITGSNFGIGATVKFVGNTGTEYAAGNVTRVSGSQITCKTTSLMGTADDPYDVLVTNASGLSALLEEAFTFNAAPVFVTAAGQLGGPKLTGVAITGSTIDVSATDAEGNTITYSVISGSLPTGLTLSSSTGYITGTPTTAGTSIFEIRASTTEGNAARVFSIRVIAGPTGGTITTSGTNIIHTFNSPGSFATSSTVSLDALIVGGGGGGAGSFAGGGGAGGVVYTTARSITSGTYPVTIGTGGQGGIGWQNVNQMRGDPGTNSSVFSLTANGGGGGGSFDYQYSPAGIDQTARTGGSGGGGGSAQSTMPGAYFGAASNQPSYPGATSYGNSGGNGYFPASPYNGGGGGGAGAAGQAGSPGGGGGGNGRAFSITGSSVTYAGGGGGSSQGDPVAPGGTGGGGTGTNTSTVAQAGGTNLGGGGGAGGYSGPSNSRLGASGGTGVVIIKYDSATLS
jgi:hypothetical protein